MRYRTALMKEILKSPTAQRMIDFVAPIYGESFTALWLYEVIGRTLDEITLCADSLREQAMPQHATWMLPYWEREYGTVPEKEWSAEQRQENLLAKIRYVAPANPAKLIMFARAVTGGTCEIIENVAKNTFLVKLHGYSGPVDRVKAYLDSAKPAHLLMEFAVDWSAATGIFRERFVFDGLRFPFTFVSYGGGIIRLNGDDCLDGGWLLDQMFQGIKHIGTGIVVSVEEKKGSLTAGLDFGLMEARTRNGTSLEAVSARASIPERQNCRHKSMLFHSAYTNKYGGVKGTLTLDSMWRLDGSSTLNGGNMLNAAISEEAI